eukprot:768002-Hanusia_phi.AAC.3
MSSYRSTVLPVWVRGVLLTCAGGRDKMDVRLRRRRGRGGMRKGTTRKQRRTGRGTRGGGR